MAYLPDLWRSDASDLFPWFDRIMDRSLSPFSGGPRATALRRDDEAWMPALDLREVDDGYRIKLELPGIEPEDVTVTAKGNELTIQGETRKEEEHSGQTLHRRELRYGKFFRTMTLPGLDEGKVVATYKNGILEVQATKKAEQKTRTVKIEVKK